MSTNRRRFLILVLGGGLLGFVGIIVYPLISFLIPPKAAEPNVEYVKIGPASEFPPNSGRSVEFGRKPLIVIKTESGDVRAFSAICTHLDSIVQYRANFKHIWCACHDGHYDLRGRNIAGPPPRPLEQFAVNLVDGAIVVSKA